MSFIHDAPDFRDLLGIVAGERALATGLVEKDYWVTHALWALHEQGFEVWFKGGTSLSKGFGLIERFSEDLDLKVGPGTTTLPAVTNWKSEGTTAIMARKASFETLARLFTVPGAQIEIDPAPPEKLWRGVKLRVNYPGAFVADLGALMRPFVLLEIGDARVTPFVECDLTSFVHAELERQGRLGEFDDNRPRRVRCVHPLVTLLEKLDALCRRFPDEKIAPATFVRHFEDAARIIQAADTLPRLDGYADARALAAEMAAQKQLAAAPRPDAAAFAPGGSERWRATTKAYDAIKPMYWGARMTVDDACAIIRRWVTNALV
ncbi:MAG: nucleotidyl transferase AbiEii/AbiGii toxin family protein [Acidobacteriota bacterium]